MCVQMVVDSPQPLQTREKIVEYKQDSDAESNVYNRSDLYIPEKKQTESEVSSSNEERKPKKEIQFVKCVKEFQVYLTKPEEGEESQKAHEES